MNRIIMPPPPSVRRQRGGDSEWKAKLRDTVVQAIGYAARHETMDQGEMRNKLIRAARAALGEATNAELVDRIDKATGDDKDIEEITLGLRYIVQTEVPHPIDSLTIESIMDVIQKAMDTEFSRALDTVVRLMAASRWHDGGKPLQGQRGEILDRLVREAHEASVAVLDESNRRVDPEAGIVLSSIGLLRSMLGGFDLSSPDRVRSLMDQVKRSAQSELARPIPGQKRD